MDNFLILFFRVCLLIVRLVCGLIPGRAWSLSNVKTLRFTTTIRRRTSKLVTFRLKHIFNVRLHIWKASSFFSIFFFRVQVSTQLVIKVIRKGSKTHENAQENMWTNNSNTRETCLKMFTTDKQPLKFLKSDYKWSMNFLIL